MKAKTRQFSFKLFSVMFIHPPGDASFCARFNAATRDVSEIYANSIYDLIQITFAGRNDIHREVILSKDLLHVLCKRITHTIRLQYTLTPSRTESGLAKYTNSKISGAKRAGGTTCRRETPLRVIITASPPR